MKRFSFIGPFYIGALFCLTALVGFGSDKSIPGANNPSQDLPSAVASVGATNAASTVPTTPAPPPIVNPNPTTPLPDPGTVIATMGVPKGIIPGRVVWVHNTNAVNQDCVPTAPAHAWYLRENNNQTVIDGMLSSSLQRLSATTSDAAAWEAIFKFHNNTRGKGTVNYVRGEKIFIKINATSAWTGNFNTDDLSANNQPPTQSNYSFVSETSVGPVLAVLRQLVNVVGVDQKDIYVGDPLKHIYKHLYDVWHAEFPNVHYIDNGGYTNLGRETVTANGAAVINYSDRGTILKTNVWSDGYVGDAPTNRDYLYSIFKDAEYMINIPMLKAHKRAGVTMFAKNHFGSQTRSDASHLHNGLVAPTEMPNVSRGSYGLYRVQVDIMGHSLLGKKNLLYLMDALWSTDKELGVPLKWQMPPFYNTYTASLFASLDPVAIESVGYDFLRTEFTRQRIPAADVYAQMPGVDDYLRQAADPANWPSGVRYDPDNTGAAISSLGAHEHWNNSTQKQYARNLVSENSGIELALMEQSPVTTPPKSKMSAISTRAFCGTDNNVTIGGFVISNAPKRVLLQAVGPTLTTQGISQADVLLDPTITLYDVQGKVIGSNDNWGDNDNASDIKATATLVSATNLAASDTTSSALLVTLPQGAFSVIARGKNRTTGIVLIEVYDADPAGTMGTLLSLSSRAYCGTGDRRAIGGYIVSGAPKRVMMRAVGPTLGGLGIAPADALYDPAMTVYSYSPTLGNVVAATNDNMSENEDVPSIINNAARLYAQPIAPYDTTSSVLFRYLGTGGYSFVVNGNNNGTGIVLIEVYDADSTVNL